MGAMLAKIATYSNLQFVAALAALAGFEIFAMGRRP